MAAEPKQEESALDAWRSIVPLVRGMVAGRSERELDVRPEGAPFTVREAVHHIAEANVVAGGIVIAALGSPGAVFDWSWMLPFGAWMQRLRYDAKPVEPSLRLIDALNAYVAAQVEPLADGLERRVQLVDQPGAAPRAVTVADVLRQEAEHARGHAQELRSR